MPDSQHVTLTANTVATITLNADYDVIEVLNLDGAAAVYFTVGGPNVAPPTVAGAGTLVLPAAIGGVDVRPRSADLTTVKLISTGTPKVTVNAGWNA